MFCYVLLCYAVVAMLEFSSSACLLHRQGPKITIPVQPPATGSYQAHSICTTAVPSLRRTSADAAPQTRLGRRRAPGWLKEEAGCRRLRPLRALCARRDR